METDSENVRDWLHKQTFPNTYVAYWVSQLKSYVFEIKVVKTKQMWADPLSRRRYDDNELQPEDEEESPRDIKVIRSQMVEDPLEVSTSEELNIKEDELDGIYLLIARRLAFKVGWDTDLSFNVRSRSKNKARNTPFDRGIYSDKMLI